VVQNNIFAGSSNETWYYIYIQSGTYRGDNNLFFGGANGWQDRGVTMATLVAWRASSGQDGRSLNSDPLFVSSSDFRLKPSSPAIDAGVNVGLTKDILGVAIPQGSAPDIGAYEVGGPRPPTAVIIKK
jgi:hypothetical protein